MGAYATDYISSAVNNSNYAGSTVSKAISAASVTQTATKVVSSAGSVAGSVLNVGGKILSRANPYITALTTAYSLGSSAYDYFTADEKTKLTEPEKEVVQQTEAIQKVAEVSAQKAETLKQTVQIVADSVSYEQGQTLPSVLSQNAKALTLSVNALTTTLNEQLSLLNNYMMANLIYQQQFLDLKTEESNLKVESMIYDKSLENQVYDSDGNLLSDMVSPREWAVRKNATVAKDTTDKINYDVDDFLDDSSIDLSSIIGYEDGSDIMREYISNLGGTVL